ncbi:T9SS type A sorting domain-containing protein [candidate division KSB1 bacterium]|nr:T9SS type A sorting domain-containing protein [candidate division KSB1 bacterium]
MKIYRIMLLLICTALVFSAFAQNPHGRGDQDGGNRGGLGGGMNPGGQSGPGGRSMGPGENGPCVPPIDSLEIVTISGTVLIDTVLTNRALVLLDEDDDAVGDYVLNFGPRWFAPSDSNLTLPEAGDEVTIEGVVRESRQFEIPVLVVLTLDGAVWFEPRPKPSVDGGRGKRGEGDVQFSLNQNRPNPFNPVTTISFKMENDSFVTLRIYNIMGQQVGILVNGNLAAGVYQVNFNASELPSGTYFYELQVGTKRQIRKMNFLK